MTNDPGRQVRSALGISATTRAVRVSLSTSGLTEDDLADGCLGKTSRGNLTDCPSWIKGRSEEATDNSTQTRLRSTMTNSSVSRLSRPTAVPSSTLRSTTRPVIGATTSCRRRRASGASGSALISLSARPRAISFCRAILTLMLVCAAALRERRYCCSVPVLASQRSRSRLNRSCCRSFVRRLPGTRSWRRQPRGSRGPRSPHP